MAAAHILYAPSIVESVLSIMKSFVKEKHMAKVNSGNSYTINKLLLTTLRKNYHNHFYNPRSDSTRIWILCTRRFPDIFFLKTTVGIKCQLKNSWVSSCQKFNQLVLIGWVECENLTIVFPDAWGEFLVEQEPFFQSLNTFKVDESLKPKEVNDDFYGYQGNFRKLEVD